MRLYAQPRPVIDPHEWPGMELYAATILLEAEGEPEIGKQGVAWVIRNRLDERRASLYDVILAPYQFSCWNSDYSGQRKARLTGVNIPLWESCWQIATGVYYRWIPDPTMGANHYLNVAVTKQMNNGRLPSWYDPLKVTMNLGRHTFLKL